MKNPYKKLDKRCVVLFTHTHLYFYKQFVIDHLSKDIKYAIPITQMNEGKIYFHFSALPFNIDDISSSTLIEKDGAKTLSLRKYIQSSTIIQKILSKRSINIRKFQLFKYSLINDTFFIKINANIIKRVKK